MNNKHPHLLNGHVESKILFNPTHFHNKTQNLASKLTELDELMNETDYQESHHLQSYYKVTPISKEVKANVPLYVYLILILILGTLLSFVVYTPHT